MQSYSPLRYPGGKSQISRLIATIIERNNLVGGSYAEPYAGGAGVALFLLLHGYMTDIFINDIDYSIYAFWYSVIKNTDELCKMINDTPVSLDNWAVQKGIQKGTKNHTLLEVGFSTFFLNRTNRSGILNGGIIGGHQQNGNYKIDCRYNKIDLINRIQQIADRGDAVHVSNLDAIKFLNNYEHLFGPRALIYLDPPYYNKGQKLYVNFYTHDNHVQLKEYISNMNGNWIVTYDDTEAISNLYSDCNKINLAINYFAAEKRKGAELLFYSPQLIVSGF
jgi:DNA adenine methylase